MIMAMVQNVAYFDTLALSGNSDVQGFGKGHQRFREHPDGRSPA